MTNSSYAPGVHNYTFTYSTNGIYTINIECALSGDSGRISDVISVVQNSDSTDIDSILADTDELQQNQSNFVTATGFVTPAQMNDNTTDILNQVSKNASDIISHGDKYWNTSEGSTASVNYTEVENAVWDANQSDHTNSGTFGYYLDSQVSSVNVSNATIDASSIWNYSIDSGESAGDTITALYDAIILSGYSASDSSVTETDLSSVPQIVLVAIAPAITLLFLVFLVVMKVLKRDLL